MKKTKKWIVKKAAARDQPTIQPRAGRLARRDSGQLHSAPSNFSRAVGTNERSQSIPSVTKKPRSRIPEPQVMRILQRHVMGQSQRQIAREEERSRPAIARIVKGDEMRAHVQKIREQFAGLAEDAVSALRFVLREQKDARAAFQVLQNIGVFVPCEVQGQAAEVAEDELTLEWATRLALMALERNKVYGTELPKLEEPVRRRADENVAPGERVSPQSERRNR